MQKMTPTLRHAADADARSDSRALAAGVSSWRVERGSSIPTVDLAGCDRFAVAGNPVAA